jgi:N-methylhydantoinase A
MATAMAHCLPSIAAEGRSGCSPMTPASPIRAASRERPSRKPTKCPKSSDDGHVHPQPREFPRAKTTILNASRNPLLADYIERIDGGLCGFEGERSLFIMQSNGGLIPPSLVGGNVCKLVLSGPAGGVVARALLPDESNTITLDVGGTRLDLCLIVNSRPNLRLQPSALDLQPVRAVSLGI